MRPIRLLIAYGLLTTQVLAASPDLISEGRAVYNFRCYFCHGYSGNAKTVAANLLNPPPANFTDATPQSLPVERIISTLEAGRPGTAMKSFASVLSERELKAVANFVFDEFVVRKANNTQYHTDANGWPNHDRYRIAYPFATGEIPLAKPWDELTAEQAQGKRLFLESCITCHDRGGTTSQEPAWEARPLSYPRNNFSYTTPPRIDATTGASPYALHDIPPRPRGLTRSQKTGERLFQANCAFCHAADGTGKNWIGSFLEPHPRNLRDTVFMSGITRTHFIAVVQDGLPNTSMPAWKNVLTTKQIEAVADYVDKAFHPLRGTPRRARDADN